jgi:hypothetical protein
MLSSSTFGEGITGTRRLVKISFQRVCSVHALRESKTDQSTKNDPIIAGASPLRMVFLIPYQEQQTATYANARTHPMIQSPR